MPVHPDSVRTARRVIFGSLALGLGVATVLSVWENGGGWHAAAFAVAPDVALLFGMGRGLARGQIHPRAVIPYNILHAWTGPLALAALTVVLGMDRAWLSAALAWGTHITADRALGYGPRTSAGFRRD